MNDGKVLGIGGLFIRSERPQELAAWYRKHLGFTVTAAGKPDPDGNWTWAQEAGETVLSIFPAESDYFAPERQMMLNLRVSGLAALTGKLEDAGIAISHREQMDGVGRFARLHDCDGNPVELWEPAAPQ